MTVSMPSTREELVSCTSVMVTSYFHLDNELFFAYLDEDCVWVMPNHDICHGILEARAQFKQGWIMPRFEIYDMHFELVESVLGDTAVVMGPYRLLSASDSEQIMAMSQHLSAVWCRSGGVWRIKYLHVSAEWSETVRGEVYPIELSRQTWRYAQAIIVQGLKNGHQPLMVKGEHGELLSVDLVTVLHVQAAGKRCTLHIGDDNGSRTVEAACSLAELEGKLPAGFVRVHRSYIVNRDHVQSVGPEGLVLSDGTCVPVPTKRRAEIRRMLQQGA